MNGGDLTSLLRAEGLRREERGNEGPRRGRKSEAEMQRPLKAKAKRP